VTGAAAADLADLIAPAVERFPRSAGPAAAARTHGAAPVAEARASRQTPPAADVDDTGGREGQPRAWLWTVVTAGGTVLAGRWSRRRHVAHDLWGERVWEGW
jgi:hypothetical protein